MQLSRVNIDKKRTVEVPTLPEGWQREETHHKSGKIDVCYYSPDGKKIKSKSQLANLANSGELGPEFDIGRFDYETGRINQHKLPATPSFPLSRISLNSNQDDRTSSYVGNFKRRCKPQISTSTNLRQQLEFSNSLVPPIRQTASIFKQPVTTIRNHPYVEKPELKTTSREKPKQLFWEKRLEDLRACHSTGEELDLVSLPNNLKAVGPNVNEQTALQSLTTALHINNAGVLGQTAANNELTENTMAFMNPEQPLVQAILVSEEDIRKQEDRVNLARRKLQDALKS